MILMAEDREAPTPPLHRCDRCGREESTDEPVTPAGWSMVTITTTNRCAGFNACRACTTQLFDQLEHQGEEVTRPVDMRGLRR